MCLREPLKNRQRGLAATSNHLSVPELVLAVISFTITKQRSAVGKQCSTAPSPNFIASFRHHCLWVPFPSWSACPQSLGHSPL
ncbi:hypothetical protein PILCRDRAFT_451117 [Piloderma croceum F 1598]|uniref:Uncharacterized protein n=1 Tax=Piloderma croceum (strain F 1598) TaxID=765440 RepID=A0A0C3BA34_PILCF|nr:hypothetical protein PILCRDRAFT_451117 [Piloderma croceum F 1598]